MHDDPLSPDDIATWEGWRDAWGTDDTVTLDLYAPTAAADPSYRAWRPRYERHSATPAALRELLPMLAVIDVRPVLPALAVPTLVLHRTDDCVVPVSHAREIAELVPTADLVELDGVDHFPQIGDMDSWVAAVERFTTGRVTPRRQPDQRRRATIRTLGGFDVLVDGERVPVAAWGSRQARQLCKRLAVAVGQPVTRDELCDGLWPTEADPTRLSARLSVVLSHVRRVLGGGVLGDRAAVRRDLGAVHLDLAEIAAALADGDDRRATELYDAELLPEDRTRTGRQRLGTGSAPRSSTPTGACSPPPRRRVGMPMPRRARSASSCSTRTTSAPTRPRCGRSPPPGSTARSAAPRIATAPRWPTSASCHSR